MQSLWMVASAVFYALYGMSLKYAGALGVGAWEVLFYRSFFGLVVFFILMHRSGIVLSTTHGAAHLVRSVAGTGAIAAGIYSISHLNLGLAMTLNYTAPLFLGTFVVLYSLAHHARINWGLMGSLALGFAGVIVLLGPTIGPSEYAAAAVGLGAGLCTALATGFVKRLGNYHEPDARIIFYLMLAGSVVGIVAVAFSGGFSAVTGEMALWILAFCVCSTLGQLLLTRAFSHGNMVLAGALQYSVILFSTILGVWVFDDTVTAAASLGMVLIVVSGLAASWFTKREGAKVKELKAAREDFKSQNLRERDAKANK